MCLYICLYKYSIVASEFIFVPDDNFKFFVAITADDKKLIHVRKDVNEYELQHILVRVQDLIDDLADD